MNTIGGYFLNSMEDAISIKDNIVMGKKFRFTFLTDRLVRLEYNANGNFIDNPTQNVIFRKFPKVEFKVTQSEMLMQISTSYFTLDYVKESPFASSKLTPGNTLKITLNNTDRIWYYGHPEARNFGGINYSLDNFSGNLKLDKGLYSTDGFAILDDSNSYIIDNSSNFVKRSDSGIDVYVFMYRKDLGLCLKDYYTLTGYPMLIPRYALGNWWYRNSKYTNQDIINILNNFFDEKIPLSVFMLGDKWYNSNDPLNFDNSVIDIANLKQVLNKYNVRLGITVDPQISVKNGSLSYQNISTVVQNIGNEYQFLPLDTQKINLYSTYGIRNWLSLGVDSILMDYNNIKDKSSLSEFDHFIYAMNSLLLNKRGVVLSRNHNISTHRDTIIWNGKTKVDWNTLTNLPRYNSTASNNGVSFVASAIGGYYGGVENFELYIRYIQLGVFSSMMIISSDDGKYYKREPWRWNQSEKEIIKKYLVLRNKLIPYLYTESYIYYQSGSPIIQPLYYKYPKIYDEPLYKNQYFFGSQMLVCPITKKKNSVMNRVVQRMFIPEGIWYELESGKKYLGNKYYMSFYKDEDYPVFVREGSIIIMSCDNSTNLPVNMEINVYPGSNGTYKLYEDDGISNNYKNGSFSITDYNFNYSKDSYEFVINNTSNPGLIPSTRNYKVIFKNTKAANVSVSNGVNAINAKSYVFGNDFVVEVNNISTGSELKIVCSGENLLNSMERLINDDIRGILEDLEIETTLKEKIDAILFSDLPIKKKRIQIRKLKRSKLEPKFIKMFISLLEYIDTV